ncbi:MAG: alkaline phosphatase family protein [Brevundimonas sp.]|uniref:alkaline phosphatase family protein n=1 Tax=Brevundimonas sp. TaxID=1871086 RepID=UPI002735317A|nr:alkaline phosphatase family protein [Brevundimonas sp.]MDP3406441.1 alkaline phosphatase family protein [Brevundimonas sp.]
MSRLLASLCVALAAAPLAARAQTPEPTTEASPPALIVTIVVDQFSADLFNQYRDRFTGGLKTLADQGLVYANGYQQHAMTETCPGHATVLTGLNPARAGIPANDWIDRTTGQEVYCLAAPQNTLAHGRNTDNGPVGPGQLTASTLGDWLKAVSPQSRVYAVSGKDRGAITLNGHQGDGAFWYTVGFGFTTYVEPGQAAEARLAPVADLNGRISARLQATPPSWTYSDETCRALEADWTVGGASFRATLPPQRLLIDVSPQLDELTLEAATELLDSRELGRRGVTDMLGVSLSATDRIGHTFGNQGPEMCDQMYRLDRALGVFLDRVAQVPGGALVVLTADHGGNDFPERQSTRGFSEAKRGDPALLARVNAVLREEFDLAVGPLTQGGSGLMVVGTDNIALPQPLRARVAAAAVERLRTESSVAGAWTIEQALAAPAPAPDASPEELSLLERQRLGAVEGRSPDILIALQPGTTPGAGRAGLYVAGHGTPWNYDRRVPIIFWSPGGSGQERYLPIRTIDIAPTLARTIGLDTPEDLDGRCLDLGLFGAAPCAAAD